MNIRSRAGRRLLQTWTLLLVLLLAITLPGTGLAQVKLPEVVVENGTVMLPVIYGNESAVSGLIEFLQTLPEFAGMSMVLLQPKGAAAMVLLSGSNEEGLRNAAEKLRGLLAECGRPHRIVISAYLREMDLYNAQSAGIDWSSLTGNLAYGITKLERVIDLRPGANPVRVDTLEYGLTGASGRYYGFNAQLTRALSKSRVIMGSNLYTPNGMTGELLSQTIVPLQTTDSNGNSILTSQTISSDVKITPTIVKYNAENPAESVIKLDIFMEMALINGTVQVGTSTAKEFSTKTLTTMGYVKADTNVYVVGIFAGDTETKYVSGIPILMNIPYLKYLFSQKTTQMNRKVGILTVSVRILPEEF